MGGAVQRPEVTDGYAEDEAAYYYPQAREDEGGHCNVGGDEEGAVAEDAGEEDEGGELGEDEGEVVEGD